jgi:hypothetical protein
MIFKFRMKLFYFGAITAALAISQIAVAWTGPTATAPSGNADTPINIGSTAQTKTGALNIMGQVGVGKNDPGASFKLDVNGVVNASDFYKGGQPFNPSQWITTGSNIYYNTGNVGIGTANPDANASLQVMGRGTGQDGWLRYKSTGDWQGIHVDNTNIANNSVGILQNNDGSFHIHRWAQGDILYANSAGTITALMQGNVGIGTASPGSKLYVNGGQIKVNEAEGGSGELRVGAAWGYPGIYGDNGSRPLVLGSATGRVFVNASLGVGTDNPAQKLDVAGAAKVDYLVVDPQDAGAEGGEMSLVGASSFSNIQIDNYAGNLRFHTLAPGKVFQIVGGDGLSITSGGVRFPDGSMQTSGIISGMVIMFWSQSCPVGWTELSQAVPGGADLRGRYPVIGNPTQISQVVGQALNVNANENRAVGNHTHNYVRGGFNWNVPTDKSGGFVNWQYETNSGAPNNEAGQNNQVGGTNAPYVQMLYCYKN